MSTRAALWNDLSAAAKAWAANPKAAEGQALSDAAKAGGAAHAPEKPKASGHVIPFGRSKGTPIEEAETQDLEWVSMRLAESISDPEKARWAASNRALLEAIGAELEGR